MNWKSFFQITFYITGTLFFIFVLIATFIFIRRTVQTSKVIKKVLSSTELEDLIMKVKNGIVPILSNIGFR